MNTALTWHHIRRSPFQSLVAILITAFSFFIISTLFIVNYGLSAVLSYFESKPEVTIFLKDNLDKKTVESIQVELLQFPSIREIKFISKEQALGLYQQQNQNNPLLVEMVTANILPASFEVSVSDPKILEQIASRFSQRNDVVDEVIYQKDIIQSLLKWTLVVRRLALISVLVLSFVSFLTIFSLIAMKITNRKDEIRVSRLLGASRYYVTKPFLLEGLIYGSTGSLLGTVSSMLVFLYFRHQINQFFQPVPFISPSLWPYLMFLGVSLVSGAVIGFLPSFLGVKRYLKY